jgi:curved DNA-binding protein CbpA
VSNSDSFDDPEEDSSAVGNPYEVLNISRQASTADIKDAYRRAMKRCHPDTVADRSQSIRDAAEAEAQRLNAAYDLVRNERGFS